MQADIKLVALYIKYAHAQAQHEGSLRFTSSGRCVGESSVQRGLVTRYYRAMKQRAAVLGINDHAFLALLDTMQREAL